MRKTIGIVILIIGIVLIGVSMYIKGRVAEGRGEISEAQQKVDTGTGLFKTNPLTEGIGEELSRPAQKKIDRARHEASEYEQMAKWLQIGGIVLIVLGAGVIFIRRRKG